MAELHIRHAFVSTKPDSPDSSIVSSSEWNASEVVTGGSHGQIAVRDGASSTGLSTIDGTVANQTAGSHSGASPTTDLATQNITFATTGYILLWASVVAVVSDTSNVTVNVKRDGVVIASYGAPGNGISHTRAVAQAETVGGHTYAISCTLGSGTFTSLSATLLSLKLGAL